MQMRLLVAVALGVLLVACSPRAEQANTPMAQVASSTPTMSATDAAPTSEPAPTVLPTATPLPVPPTSTPRAASYTILVTNSAARHVSFVEPASGAIEQVEVGAAPWGLALAPNDLAYVATAEGVDVVDIRRRAPVARIPYRAQVGPPAFGEYRAGGMGIAAAPDGGRVYVGVFLPDRSGQLEVIDTAQRAVIASVPIGVRPFQVIVSGDGREIYTIDHDTFTVTVVDTTTYTARALPVEPLGNGGWGSWDKPHYAALRADGHLLLPFQGHILLDLDPASGKAVTLPMRANTHQHGLTLSPDEQHLLIVGTGPAGDAQGAPRLTILNLTRMVEEHISLRRPHEQVALSPDGCLAYVTGGHTFANGGWDGLSVVDLQQHSVTEIPVPDRPLDIAIVSEDPVSPGCKNKSVRE
jgi:YVTN family beta-propeller protein